MKPQPLVSVVTPVYNTGEFLEQAIRSVVSQSYENWEYIICENHSTDDSAAIAARYAASDARIRVVSPPTFLPQAENFNFALQQIAPDSVYCKMVLADDALFPECLAEMVAVAETRPTVSAVASYRLVETQGEGFGLPLDRPVISGRTAGRLHLLQGIFLFGTPSTVMYRSDVVRSRNPRFYPTDRFFHDTEAIFQILEDTDFGFVHQVLSFSRYQPGSITHRVADFYWREIDLVLCLRSYGRRYLDEDEYEQCWRRANRRYYERLGRERVLDLFRRGSDEFWSFHSARLSSVGLAIDRRALALGAVRAMVRALGSPAKVLDRIIDRHTSAGDPWRDEPGQVADPVTSSAPRTMDRLSP